MCPGMQEARSSSSPRSSEAKERRRWWGFYSVLPWADWYCYLFSINHALVKFEWMLCRATVVEQPPSRSPSPARLPQSDPRHAAFTHLIAFSALSRTAEPPGRTCQPFLFLTITLHPGQRQRAIAEGKWMRRRRGGGCKWRWITSSARLVQITTRRLVYVWRE